MKSGSFLERKAYAEGATVFKEGDHGNCAFIVQEGQVEILIGAGTDKEKVLGTVGKGGIFGEMALIDEQPRMATARTTVKSTLIIASRMMLNEKLQRADPFIRGLLKIMVSNIRAMAESEKKKLGIQVPEHSQELF